jgi:aminopeptidase N
MSRKRSGRQFWGIVALTTMLTTSGLILPGSTLALPADYSDALSTPVADPYYPSKGTTVVDALHYDLDLRWSPRSRSLHGKAKIALRVTRDTERLRLDFGRRLNPVRARLDGQPLAFSHPGDKLVAVTPTLVGGSQHTLTVVYRGRPRPTKAPTKRPDIPALGWTTTKDGGMWTMQEPYGALTWYPVNDHPSDKAFYDVHVDVPSSMVGVSNGALVSRRTHSGRTTTHWRMSEPAASYLVTLAIGDYVAERDEGPHGLPLTYWVRRDQREYLPTLRQSPAIFRWLERTLGPYPFDTAGVVVVPSDSAMETQELVTMGSGRMGSRQPAVSVLAHEYAHQWYGDTVTPDNWQDLWLNESFAMYVEIQFRIARGWETRRWWRDVLEANDQAFRKRNGPPGAYEPDNFGSACVYYCGALMLFELGDSIGSSELASALRAWPQSHQNTNADREDYVTWVSGRVGSDLTGFFDDWLMSRKTPPT